MACAACGRANPPGARFCGGCGGSLAPRCPACGAESAADARFCIACGASLAARPADGAGERKVVSIVFADLAGSTALHERLDAESTRAFMDRYYRAMQGAVEAHGGTITQLLGDGVKAVFGAPRVAEDDALRAVRAAVEMQRAFRALASEQSSVVGAVGLRVAVNTGEVVAKDESEIIGDPVNVAARLQQEAHDGDVLIGASTQRLVSQLVTLAPFGTFSLKGRAEPVSAYRVVSLERPAGASAIAFVGREEELRRLMAVYEAAVAGPGARLAVILGSPGLGKSRLLDELGRRLGDRATLLLARCDATGGATFAPIAEALRALLGIDAGADRDSVRAAIDSAIPGEDAERARIADGVAALLAGTPASPEESFFVVRRLLTGLAAVRPVVLAIDDLQWAEPLLLDLTEHLVQWSRDAPLLVLAAARPELREARSSLATPGGLVADVVTLSGLDAVTATRLAASVIGADALPAAIAGRVLATSEGNPLFVGELVRMLVQDGVLRREGDRWTAGVELSSLEMPPTIHALLAARIERLRPEERSVLERAAVVGRQFSRAAVAHLLPPEIRDLDARLESLRRSELVEPDTGWLLGEPMLRFHHVLIRDAAYRRLLKHTRAELHGRFADWLEARVGEAVEHDETIGWHLEQAHQHLRELGPLDARGRALGERASRRLAAAGRRALARDDVPLAAGLLRRALDRLDPADPARADLALDGCEALLSAGEVGAAAAAIDELGRLAGDSPRLRAWHTCFAGQLAALTDPKALRTTAGAVALAAEALAAAGDGAGEAKAHSVHASALMRLGEIGACEAALDRALAAARRVGDHRRVNAVLAGAPLAALWGPSPVTRASGRCLDVVRVLRITQGAPAVEAVALRCQAVLEALRGRTEAARRMLASSRRMVEELGLTQGLLETEVSAGLIALIEGDDAAAERSLRGAYEGLRDRGFRIDAARAAALLGRTLLPQGRAAEAEALSHESEALAGDDLQAAITWRRVRAEALARRGEHASAVEFARAAVDIAATTDALLHHAEARLALAIALRTAGRSDEADAEEHRAIEFWEAKGATLLAERARREAVRVQPAARARAESHEAKRAPIRRVRANAATANAARFDAAIVARDLDCFGSLVHDELEVVHHPTGAEWGRGGMLATLRILFDAEATVTHEPLATLGECLALCRGSVSGGEIVGGEFPPFGDTEADLFVLLEVDEQARRRRAEYFRSEHLGDAVARLYERYAELLPEGPERELAAATARAAAAMLAQRAELDRWVSALAPGIEHVDHRTVGFGGVLGLHEFRVAIASLFELAADVATRIDDITELRSDAVLLRWTNFGTQRTGGGAFERPFLWLGIFGADGLLTRIELFDPEHEAEALTRFDELTAGPPVLRPTLRRVRANAATANVLHLDAVIAARDADALPMLLADDEEVIDHTTGAVYARSGELDFYRRQLRTRDLTHRLEPLAALGDSLALGRLLVAGSAAIGRTWDVGAFDSDNIELIEVDAQGRRRRLEIFAADRLGDAIARLYARYAELLPEGLERTRAAATARSVAAVLGPFDLDRYAPAWAASIEYVDHRVQGIGSLRGAQTALRWLSTLLEVAEDVANRCDDVLALRTDAFLLRWMNQGRERASGGSYERPLLWLGVFGADGLLIRSEWFDPERESEALARFDELTAEPPAVRPARRRVRANAATATTARLDRVIADRDADALPTLFADDVQCVDHRTGTSWDREGWLFSLRSLLHARDPRVQHEPLATLGASLALCRWSTSGSGFAGGTFDVGAYEREEIPLVEVDAQGRARRLELFAPGHLGDAIARLYERYAELLPEGPERGRAAATARSVAVLPLRGARDPDRLASAFAPSIQWEDPRSVGFGTLRGPEAVLRGLHALSELVETSTVRVDDILALRSDALLVRWTHSAIDRAGGGPVELPRLMLWVFGADGLLTRWVQLDADRADEALARFDALTAEATAAPRPARRRVRANAATASEALLGKAVAARDVDSIAAHLARLREVVDHQRAATYDREGSLATFRGLLKARDGTYQAEPLATLGDSLALCRQRVSATGVVSGTFDVGAYEMENVVLAEADEQGRRRTEVFAADRLGDAVVRLYERYAELLPEGPERQQIAATARSIESHLGPLDPKRFLSALAPTVDYVDHRLLVGLGSVHGLQELREVLRSLFEAAADLTNRADDVLAALPDALLVRITNLGTERAGGGSFERPFLVLWTFGADGLMTHTEQFDVGHEAEALARFDELTTASPAPRFTNAATRTFARAASAADRRDWEGFAALFAAGFRASDRRRLIQTDLDRDTWLASYRPFIAMTSSRTAQAVLATRGDRLALVRFGWTGSDDFVGPSAIDYLLVIEVDGRGDHAALVLYDPDHLDAAYEELDRRFAAGEGAPHAELLANVRAFMQAFDAGDDHTVRRVLPDDYTVFDHRRIVGTDGPVGRDEWFASFRNLGALGEFLSGNRLDHILKLSPTAAMGVLAASGTVDGGAHEGQQVVVLTHDGSRPRSAELFDLEQLEAAYARYEELTAVPPPPRPRIENAATRWMRRGVEAWRARDVDGDAPGFAPGFRSTDRRRLVRLELDRDEFVTSYRRLVEMTTGFSGEVLATRGDRLALLRVVWEGTDHSVGPSEIESLAVVEVDDLGDALAVVEFDPDDLDAAYAELDARYGATRVPIPLVRSFNARDWDGVTALLAPDLVIEDHRRLGWETLHGTAAYIASLQALVDLAPDARLRLDHLEESGRVSLGVTLLSGTREGGTFEDARAVSAEQDAQGRVRRFSFYDLDQLDVARARYAAIGASAPRDPLAALAKPNAATAAMDRLQAAFEARDWPAVRALAADAARFEDRRRHALHSGDADWWLADLKQAAEGFVSDVRYQRRLVSTAGDRVCLERVFWTGGPAGGRVEIEYLWLAQVDESGRLVAGVMFDPEDWRAASLDAWGRWFARDAAAAAVFGPTTEFIEGGNDRDRARMRAALADDVVVHDRRLVGQGEVTGADAYLDSVAVLWNLAPDTQVEPRFVLALERYGAVAVARTFGTLADGGAFEIPVIIVATVARSLVSRIEVFELEAVDAALARLAELRPDPLRIPPNAATRTSDRAQECMETGAWETLRALCEPIVFEDRRRLIRTSGGCDMAVANGRVIAEAGGRFSRSVLATAGDHLALEHIVVSGPDPAQTFEVEALRLFEVDAEGRLVAAVIFDPDDRRAASVEMIERHFLHVADLLPQAGIEAMRVFIIDHDLDRLRALLPGDFFLDDHRRTGVGRIDGADAFIESLAALFGEAPDLLAETLYGVAAGPQAVLEMARMFGTLAASGGAFESFYVRLWIFAGDRLAGIELFEPEDLERARARFEVLRAAAA